ncbi:MYG1 family protein [Teichococcus oryzae]|uniref:MYG1 family protein n=1 Tax=Teichococcus oryzae TaxID=1608942 RepID=A0A5B2TDA9_9PROT|nr:MYG1 family protein [Pseudoroseomonas oryzae]KAA2212492.1 MYG1 family protein [Pseudoroseomonas oryzae]
MNSAPTPLLVTHSGGFHCDDALAYAVLRLALGLGEAGIDHTLIRTRDADIIARADIAFDVGLVHDAEAGRFDHHQRGAPVREDGLPFSAAGLVWQRYGVDATRALLRPLGEAAEALAPQVAASIDDSIIRRVDAIDNGVGPRDDTLGLGALVGDFNPPWDSPALGDMAAEDALFREASALCEAVLRRRVNMVRAKLAGEVEVLAAHAAGDDPRLLVMDRKLPWRSLAFRQGWPILYAIYPVPNGNWMVDAMPPEPGSFAQRLPLPEAWAGLQGPPLVAASGIPDAVFVHVKRFIGSAGSRQGALAMARAAMALGGA